MGNSNTKEFERFSRKQLINKVLYFRSIIQTSEFIKNPNRIKVIYETEPVNSEELTISKEEKKKKRTKNEERFENFKKQNLKLKNELKYLQNEIVEKDKTLKELGILIDQQTDHQINRKHFNNIDQYYQMELENFGKLFNSYSKTIDIEIVQKKEDLYRRIKSIKKLFEIEINKKNTEDHNLKYVTQGMIKKQIRLFIKDLLNKWGQKKQELTRKYEEDKKQIQGGIRKLKQERVDGFEFETNLNSKDDIPKKICLQNSINGASEKRNIIKESNKLVKKRDEIIHNDRNLEVSEQEEMKKQLLIKIPSKGKKYKQSINNRILLENQKIEYQISMINENIKKMKFQIANLYQNLLVGVSNTHSNKDNINAENVHSFNKQKKVMLEKLCKLLTNLENIKEFYQYKLKIKTTPNSLEIQKISNEFGSFKSLNNIIALLKWKQKKPKVNETKIKIYELKNKLNKIKMQYKKDLEQTDRKFKDQLLNKKSILTFVQTRRTNFENTIEKKNEIKKPTENVLHDKEQIEQPKNGKEIQEKVQQGGNNLLFLVLKDENLRSDDEFVSNQKTISIKKDKKTAGFKDVKDQEIEITQRHSEKDIEIRTINSHLRQKKNFNVFNRFIKFKKGIPIKNEKNEIEIQKDQCNSISEKRNKQEQVNEYEKKKYIKIETAIKINQGFEQEKEKNKEKFQKKEKLKEEKQRKNHQKENQNKFNNNNSYLLKQLTKFEKKILRELQKISNRVENKNQELLKILEQISKKKNQDEIMELMKKKVKINEKTLNPLLEQLYLDLQLSSNLLIQEDPISKFKNFKNQIKAPLLALKRKAFDLKKIAYMSIDFLKKMEDDFKNYKKGILNSLQIDQNNKTEYINRFIKRVLFDYFQKIMVDKKEEFIRAYLNRMKFNLDHSYQFFTELKNQIGLNTINGIAKDHLKGYNFQLNNIDSLDPNKLLSNFTELRKLLKTDKHIKIFQKKDNLLKEIILLEEEVFVFKQLSIYFTKLMIYAIKIFSDWRYNFSYHFTKKISEKIDGDEYVLIQIDSNSTLIEPIFKKRKKSLTIDANENNNYCSVIFPMIINSSNSFIQSRFFSL
ncbi:hypothetical protein M0812_23105 [Anaeramoeba flamelloides]|uniref:Uncharacterized protein n=1 Tax=Anaeramoeba flamelloides TaxID=1746091 RepID=A0AAV7YQ67_9EUKA|nr:hypothetical protein M0812_23105 [Anaeramoeba flamelloides]